MFYFILLKEKKKHETFFFRVRIIKLLPGREQNNVILKRWSLVWQKYNYAACISHCSGIKKRTFLPR